MEEKQKCRADELCRISAHTQVHGHLNSESLSVSGIEERWSTSLRSPVGKVYHKGDFHSCSSGPLA